LAFLPYLTSDHQLTPFRQHDQKNLYATSLEQTHVSSYKVTSPSSIEFAKSIKLDGACPGTFSSFGMVTLYDIALPPPSPYVLFGSWTCGVSLSVDATGTLERVVDFWPYTNSSGIHGLGLSVMGGRTIMYSADMLANTVWSHSIDTATGKATEIGRFKTRQGVRPRRITVHPKVHLAYLLTEAGNTLEVLSLSPVSGAALSSDVTYSLIPQGKISISFMSSALIEHSPILPFSHLRNQAKSDCFA
jgi:carboxy-cis,cis-muconate cyclase